MKRVSVFTESFKMKEDTNAMAAAGWNRKDVYHAESCTCGTPMECTCRVMTPPNFSASSEMAENLFYSNRPMLVWTIFNKTNPDIKMTFCCKIEQEVFEEVNRLNAKHTRELWSYVEEEAFNHRLKAEYNSMIETLKE